MQVEIRAGPESELDLAGLTASTRASALAQRKDNLSNSARSLLVDAPDLKAVISNYGALPTGPAGWVAR